MAKGSKPGQHPGTGGRAVLQNGQTVRSPRRNNHETALAAAEFWTASAMQDAEPYPMPEVGPEDVRESSRGPITQTKGVSQGIVRGRPPRAADSERKPEPAASQGGYTYPAPYTRFELPQGLYQVYPWVTCGKVFFKQRGVAYVGSAGSIGNHAIWTAGHIVHAGDNAEQGWSTDMIFVPAYRNGEAPLGRWSASFLRTTTLWYQKGNPDGLTADMAGAVLHPLDGQSISERVGSLGFAWNLERIIHWNALGYPQASPFNGQTMHDCQSSYAYDGSVAGVPPVAIGCDMTGGCSGGPWIHKFLDDNALNGNNSYRQSNRPEEMNSPYFDERAKEVYDQLIEGTPD